jgi:hypothetical protein
VLFVRVLAEFRAAYGEQLLATGLPDKQLVCISKAAIRKTCIATMDCRAAPKRPRLPKVLAGPAVAYRWGAGGRGGLGGALVPACRAAGLLASRAAGLLGWAGLGWAGLGWGAAHGKSQGPSLRRRHPQAKARRCVMAQGAPKARPPRQLPCPAPQALAPAAAGAAAAAAAAADDDDAGVGEAAAPAGRGLLPFVGSTAPLVPASHALVAAMSALHPSRPAPPRRPGQPKPYSLSLQPDTGCGPSLLVEWGDISERQRPRDINSSKMAAARGPYVPEAEYVARLNLQAALCCGWSPVVRLPPQQQRAAGASAAAGVSLLAVGSKGGAVVLWRYALPKAYAPRGGLPGPQALERLPLLHAHRDAVVHASWLVLPAGGVPASSAAAQGADLLVLLTASTGGEVKLWGASAAEVAAGQQLHHLWTACSSAGGRAVTCCSGAVVPERAAGAEAEGAAAGSGRFRVLVATGQTSGTLHVWRSGPMSGPGELRQAAEAADAWSAEQLHGTSTITGVRRLHQGPGAAAAARRCCRSQPPGAWQGSAASPRLCCPAPARLRCPRPAAQLRVLHLPAAGCMYVAARRRPCPSRSPHSSTPPAPAAGLSIHPLTHHVTSCAVNGSLANSGPPASAAQPLHKLPPPARACPGADMRLPRAWRDAALAQRPALGLARSPGGTFTALVR